MFPIHLFDIFWVHDLYYYFALAHILSIHALKLHKPLWLWLHRLSKMGINNFWWATNSSMGKNFLDLVLCQCLKKVSKDFESVFLIYETICGYG